MGSHDKLNVDNRNERKRKHNERAKRETRKMLDEWGEHITIISWLPLDPDLPIDEYLVKFKMDEAIKPYDFLSLLIEKVGGDLSV